MEYGAAAIRRVPNSFPIKGSKLKGQLTSFICVMPIKAKTVLIKQTWCMEHFLVGGWHVSAGNTRNQKFGCIQSGWLCAPVVLSMCECELDQSVSFTDHYEAGAKE